MPYCILELRVVIISIRDTVVGGVGHQFQVLLSRLPITIRRDATPASKLSLNVAKYSAKPSVKKVSHKHIEIDQVDGRFQIRCLGRNGMIVNGQPYLQNQRTAVEPQFSFVIGPFRMVFTALCE